MGHGRGFSCTEIPAATVAAAGYSELLLVYRKNSRLFACRYPEGTASLSHMGSTLGSVAGVEPPRIGRPFEEVLDDTPVEALPALVAALLADPATLSAWAHAASGPEPGDPALLRG